LGVN